MKMNQTTVDPATGQLVTVAKLSSLSGVSVTTIKALARSNMIPKPVGYAESSGMPLFDVSDPALAKWLKALQAAGYDRR